MYSRLTVDSVKRREGNGEGYYEGLTSRVQRNLVRSRPRALLILLRKDRIKVLGRLFTRGSAWVVGLEQVR